MNVSFSYDGATTLSADITGGTPATVYGLDARGTGGHSYDTATTDGSGNGTVIVDITGVATSDGDGCVGFLVTDSDFGTVSACLIKFGLPGTLTNPDTSTSWNGTDTFTLHLPSAPGVGTDLYFWDSPGETFDPSGASSTYVLTLTGSLYLGLDYIVLQEDNGTDYEYNGVWWVGTGSPAVHHPPAPSLAAGFTGTPLVGFAPLHVHFTDRSVAGPSGPITAWSWDFGDGGTASTENPTHIYSTPGTYNVQLTVTGTSPDGTDSFTRSSYVTANDSGGNWVEANAELGDAYLTKNVPSVSFNTISRVGTPTTANATSVTLPSGIVAGDVILMAVLRNGSTTAPTAPAGWTLINSGSNFGGATSWFGIFGKVAVGSDTSGTWTNASALSCSAYRNAQLPPYNLYAHLSVGNGTSLNYPAQSVEVSGSDWIVAFSMSDSSGCNSTPSGLSVPSGFSESGTRGIYDSNGALGSNFSAQNFSGQPTQKWGTTVVDLRPTIASDSDFWFEFKHWLPQVTLDATFSAGNTAVFAMYDGSSFHDDGVYLVWNPLSGGHWKWWSWWNDSTGVNYTVNTVHDVKYHFHITSGPDFGDYTGDATLYVDGTSIATYSTNLVLGHFDIGAIFPIEVACERYFFTDVKIGTTEGGTDIFAWDGSEVDFSSWDAVVGDVSIVDPPVGCAAADITLTPDHGCPGQTITITGSGFASSSALTVKFDGSSVVFSEATSDGSGDVNGTFVVPNEAPADYTVTVQDASSNVGTTTFSIDAHSVTLTPSLGSPGQTITFSGACFCPGAAWTAIWEEGVFPFPGYISEEVASGTVGGDGTISVTFVVPADARPGDMATVRIDDGCGPSHTSSFTVCASPGGTYEIIGVPGMRSSTDTELVSDLFPSNDSPESSDNSILIDWCDNATDFWMLFVRPQSDWGGTSFPPPDLNTVYPLEAHRYPKNGSAVTVYPVGTDLEWSWQFDSKFVSTPFCGVIHDCGVDCTPGKTGYWWRMVWWFKGYKKPIINARIQTDGENVWVGAIGLETEIYPWISKDDFEITGCPSDCAGTVGIPSQDNQFIDLSTVTLGYTTFATSAATAMPSDPQQSCIDPLVNPTDYAKWGKWGTGIFPFGPHEPPNSDGGDNWTGYYQQPKLVMFALSGSDFSRIGDDPSEFVVGLTDTRWNNNTQIGWMSMASSSAEPGVCHAIWSEQGSYGDRGNGLAWDSSEENFPGGADTIGARVSYSTWDTGSMSFHSDLFTGSQDRTNWFYHDAGSGFDTDAGAPPGINFSDAFELKNQHGSPALFLSFENVLAKTHANDPSVVSSGTLYTRAGSEGTVRYYDLTDGSASLLQQITSPYIPTLAEMQISHPAATNPPNSIYQSTDLSVDQGGYKWSYLSTFSAFVALATSSLYSDPTLSQDVYMVDVSWVTDNLPPADGAVFGLYRIPTDGSATFTFPKGSRDLGLSPNLIHAITNEGGSNAIDFAIDPLSVWVPGQWNFPYYAWDRLDLGPCHRWWELLIFLGDFPSDSQLGTSIRRTHGPPILDIGAQLIYYPGTKQVSGVDVFGITATPIVDGGCSCGSTGLHVWQHF